MRISQRLSYVATGISMVFAGILLFSHSAGAISGTGYYTGSQICSTNYAVNSLQCGGAPNLGNDVVPGRTSGSSPNSVPASAAASKAGFLAWLDGLGGTYHKDLARQFIIDTMNGDGDTSGFDGLTAKLNSPNIYMMTDIRAPVESSYYGLENTPSGRTDMFFSTEWAGGPKDTLIFYSLNSNGTPNELYYLELPCGNPSGNFPNGLPDAETWTVSGKSSIKIDGGAIQQGTVDALPGQKLSWSHALTNDGPNDMSTNVSYSVPINGGYLAAGYGGIAPKTPAISGKGKGKSGKNFIDTSGKAFSLYTVQQEDIGKKLCQWIEWDPTSTSDTTSSSSTKACAKIRSNYSLYPTVTLSGGGTSGIVVLNATADQQSVVENISARADVNSSYQSYDFAVQAGKSINFGTVFTDQGNGRIFAVAPGGGTDICAWLASKYSAGTVTCKGKVASGSSMFNAGTSAVDQSTINATGFKAGDLICRMLWVDHYDYNHSSSDERRLSLPACVRVAKTPYTQFWGGDVKVGDSIGGATSLQSNAYTSSNLINGKTYGSWAEYGIFAPTNGIIRSASAGALSGKNGFVGAATETDIAHLTFANTDTPKGNWSTPATIGSYENSIGLPDGGSVAAGVISLDSLSNRGKVLLTEPSGTVHVGGTLPSGSLMLLYPTGTVVIDSNIILGKNSYSSLTDLSQVVIQAKNIIVSHDVDRVDAWLVAIAQNGTDGGVVSTCDTIVTPYYSGLTAKLDSPCNQKMLRINGPVMGREVQLRRTFGAEGDATPAEVINLRADAYLWTLQAASKGSTDTIFTTELPPRF